MASVDSYSTIGWKDSPEHQTTPTSATNFNHMDNGIKENNTAIQDLCTEVADKAPKNPTFTQASTRTNINSGESTETIFGKIKKWFASLGSLAFISTNSSTSNYLRGDGTWVTPPNTTYSNATTSAAGLMSAADKTKLNGIASGAQVNTVTGVKGSSESSYRTGNVNITKANIGLGNVDNTADANKSVNYATTAMRASIWLNNPGFNELNGYPKFDVNYLVYADQIMSLQWKHIGGNGPFLYRGTTNEGNIIRGSATHNITLSWNGSRLELYVDGTYCGRVVTD